MLPFTLLRRLDCVLAPTKDNVLAELEKRKSSGMAPEMFLPLLPASVFTIRRDSTFVVFDLSAKAVSNTDMGAMFEELIWRFAELSNETAGEHYTPREVIRLMVDLLFDADSAARSKSGIVRTIYDPAAGTDGMLLVAKEHLRGQNPNAKLVPLGQELNPESYAVWRCYMMSYGYDLMVALKF